MYRASNMPGRPFTSCYVIILCAPSSSRSSIFVRYVFKCEQIQRARVCVCVTAGKKRKDPVFTADVVYTKTVRLVTDYDGSYKPIMPRAHSASPSSGHGRLHGRTRPYATRRCARTRRQWTDAMSSENEYILNGVWCGALSSR